MTTINDVKYGNFLFVKGLDVDIISVKHASRADINRIQLML